MHHVVFTPDDIYLVSKPADQAQTHMVRNVKLPPEQSSTVSSIIELAFLISWCIQQLDIIADMH